MAANYGSRYRTQPPASEIAQFTQQYHDHELASRLQLEEVLAISLAEGSARSEVQSRSSGFEPGKARNSNDAHSAEDACVKKYRRCENEYADIPCEICSICMVTEIKSDNSHVVNEKCNHRFCTDCLRQHGDAVMKSGKFSIPCPQYKCTELWSSHLCHLLLSVDALDQLARRQVENALQGWERVYCPYKDCSALHLRPDLPAPTEPSGSRRTAVGGVECLSCHRLFCLECQVPWHNNLTCEEHESLQEDEKSDIVFLRGLAKDRQWQRCSCGFVVERNEGCNHMSCRCGKEFCYHCGGIWSYAHLCQT